MEEDKTSKPQQPTISRKEAIKNWSGFQIAPELIDALVANNFVKPTEV